MNKFKLIKHFKNQLLENIISFRLNISQVKYLMTDYNVK
jgi:hypothetical protein